jgi:RimK family alpha-L-glutamate ligase
LAAPPIGVDPDAVAGLPDDDPSMGSAVTTLEPPRIGGDSTSGTALVALVGSRQQTNIELVSAWRQHGVPAALLTPREAKTLLGPGDVAIGRLDVVPTLDGIEDGVELLDDVAWAGARLLNSRAALVRSHDKLRTARALVAARIPHPKTVHLPHDQAPLGLRPPLVLKPRYGSWGIDVFRCGDDRELTAALEAVRARRWFRRGGALLQELVASSGWDVRLLVANGRVVGGVQRVAPEGEWRTNVSLGATRIPVDPTPEMCRLAIAAAAAVGADLVGVDLLPVRDGYIVIETNGAVEFDRRYDLVGGNVYTELMNALGLPQTAQVAL